MNKLKIYFVLLLVTGLYHPASSQSIYHFKYNLKAGADSNEYQAFFVRNDAGGAFVRIRYTAPATGELILVEMNMREEAAVNENAEARTNEIFYEGVDTVFLIGDPQTGFTAPVFWYAGKTATDIFDPVAVSAKRKDNMVQKISFLQAEFIPADKLEKKLALGFFTKSDDFYQNLFEPRTRGLTPAEKTVTLHLLCIANTNDPIIGEACGKSMRLMIESFRVMTTIMGVGFKVDSLLGKTYNKNNVEKSIEKLRPSPKDILIVYYMGHGFRKTNDKRAFPYLDLRSDPNKYDYDKQSLNVQDIFDKVRAKKARFTLVFSDCCNTDPEATNIVASPVPKQRESGLPLNIDNFKTLFLDPARISILATAADVEQKATSNNNFGGFFTYFFRSALLNYLGPSKKYITWDVLIAEAKAQTVYKAEHTYCDKENICRQYPFYKKIYEGAQ